MPHKTAGDWFVDNWAALVAFLTSGALLWKLGAWIFGWGFRIKVIETRQNEAELRLEVGTEKIEETHDAVTKLVERVDSVKDGQAEILKRINSCQGMRPQ
jgi:hypothetical protein